MWTAHEIVVLCVILVDPGLQFTAILQKDKGKSGEMRQNRAMACLDNRVQQIMYSRLKAYGFVNNSHVPPDVPAGVVLNSGGSYLQLATWEYLCCARLVTDFSVNPSIIHVTGAPQYVARSRELGQLTKDTHMGQECRQSTPKTGINLLTKGFN